MARDYETQTTEPRKHYKELPKKSLGHVIPNREALKMTKIRKFSSFTEIRNFFEIAIMSKTETKINALCASPNV